eukprot:Selendium_serpulae@DN6255_c1_g3_i14.p1
MSNVITKSTNMKTQLLRTLNVSFATSCYEPQQRPSTDWRNDSPFDRRVGDGADHQTRGIDFAALLACLEKDVGADDVVVFHPVAHNPTGVDPTDAQWEQIVEVVKRRNLLALLDCAYQGYASGDLEKDARVIRMFERAGLQCIVCQSFAKNM